MAKIFRQVSAKELPTKTECYIYQWTRKNKFNENPVSEMDKAWYFCEPIGMNSIGWATNVANEIEWWLKEIELPNDDKIITDADINYGEDNLYKAFLKGANWMKDFILDNKEIDNKK